jgi:hypothetical protein
VGLSSTIENEKLRARVVPDLFGRPILLLSVRAAGGWRQVGASVPLAELEAGEAGQRAWWEEFVLQEVRSANLAGAARLTLAGAHGIRWKSEIDLTVRAGSSVIDGELRVKPTRPMRLRSIRFLPLLAGEGSFGSAVSETLDWSPKQSTSAVHQAVRWGEITVGTVTRNESPFSRHEWASLPGDEQAEYRLLGSSVSAAGETIYVERGETVRLRSRLFALWPSNSVRHAPAIPPAQSVQRGRAHRSQSL